MKLRFLFAANALFLLLVSISWGSEIRKYQFAGDVPAYHSCCGECSGEPYTTRARVEGTFEVEINADLGSGKLLSLNAQLVDFEGLFGEESWLPYGTNREFLSGSFYDRFRPPFDGVLEPTGPEEAWQLTTTGAIPNPDGSVAITARYSIYIERNEALLSVTLPIIDNTESITAARAFLVPEPTSASLAFLAMTCTLTFRRRSSSITLKR